MRRCPTCERTFPHDQLACSDDGSTLISISEEFRERPIVNSDFALAGETAPSTQTRLGGFKIPTATLRAYTMLFALVLIWVYFQFATGNPDEGLIGRMAHGVFLSPRNLSNLMIQTSVTGVLAVGMLMVIVAGQIDLSVGSVVGLTGGIAAILVTNWGWGLAPAVFVVVLVGVAIGAVNGALVAWGNIPAFIVTLGGLLAWRGAIKGISHGNTVPIALPAFKALGQQYIARPAGWAVAALAIGAVIVVAIRERRGRRTYGLEPQSIAQMLMRIALPSVAVVAFIFVMNAYAGVPIPVLFLLAAALLGVFITTKTTFGRYLYAIGGNADAARLSGINIRSHILMVYCLLGALTGVAALVYTARVGSASPDAGVLKELDAIAACVIGGASLMGGRGAVYGACLGALVMGSLDNGMSLLNVQDFTQDIVKGVILVTAVGLDMIGRRRS